MTPLTLIAWAAALAGAIVTLGLAAYLVIAMLKIALKKPADK